MVEGLKVEGLKVEGQKVEGSLVGLEVIERLVLGINQKQIGI
jgi:hypothetical protein